MHGTSEIWHKICQQCSLLLASEAGGFISTDKVNQAADQLRISRSTARSHLKSISAKLGVTSQVQLVTRLAAADGWLESPW